MDGTGRRPHPGQVLAVTCLTCAVQLARPADGSRDDADVVRSFLVRHSDDACVTGLDLPAVRPHLV